MSPSKLREKVISERIAWIRDMTANIRSLPLADYDIFTSDKRNIAAAESYLRRSLESLFDLGRHILAKGFGIGVVEYKEIAQGLVKNGLIDRETGNLLKLMAGYRNRMVHFYNEITKKELFDICSNEISDIEEILGKIIEWINNHPEIIDKTL